MRLSCQTERSLKPNSYLIEFGVCYLTLCEKSYPKKLAFTYLEELQKEFNEKYGQEVGTVARPYAFVKFDSFIQKTKRQYKDARAQRNLQKLNEDLHDVTRIMTKNIQDVLGRGETLDRTHHLSEFTDESGWLIRWLYVTVNRHAVNITESGFTIKKVSQRYKKAASAGSLPEIWTTSNCRYSRATSLILEVLLVVEEASLDFGIKDEIRV